MRAGRVLWRVLPGAVVVQRLDAGVGDEVTELTGVAAAAWLLLDESNGVDEMAEEIGCSVPAVVSAIEALESAGLVARRCGH